VASLEDFIKEYVPSAKELQLAQQRFDTDLAWREEVTQKVYNALPTRERGGFTRGRLLLPHRDSGRSGWPAC
jgi:hypothetical protein